MEPLGVLIYGYNSKMASIIEKSLNEIVNQEVLILSGSKKEYMKVIDILNKGPEDCFEDKDNKILIFLGFSEDQVGAVLKGFPKTGAINRPIFCGLTEQNMNWTLNYLIGHLVEEDKYWSEQAKKKRN